jgi:hypothetical protein
VGGRRAVFQPRQRGIDVDAGSAVRYSGGHGRLLFDQPRLMTAPLVFERMRDQSILDRTAVPAAHVLQLPSRRSRSNRRRIFRLLSSRATDEGADVRVPHGRG